MYSKIILAASILILTTAVKASAQDTCDTAALETCKAACLTAQPACTAAPLLTLAEIRAIVAEKCGCTITEADDTPEDDIDTCTCNTNVKNFGNYRSCVAQLSDALKSFKLSSAEARDALKADNSLCKSAIKGSKGNKGENGNNGNHGNKD